MSQQCPAPAGMISAVPASRNDQSPWNSSCRIHGKNPKTSTLLVLFTSREDKSWLWSPNTRISPAGRPLVIKGILLPLLEGQQQAQPSQPSPSTWGTGRIWEMGIFGSPCKRSRRDRQGRCPLLPPAHPKNCSLSHMETQTITGQQPGLLLPQKCGFQGGAGGRELQPRLFSSFN